MAFNPLGNIAAQSDRTWKDDGRNYSIHDVDNKQSKGGSSSFNPQGNIAAQSDRTWKDDGRDYSIHDVDKKQNGVNLSQIQANFQDYQNNDNGTAQTSGQPYGENGLNLDKYKTPTDDKVYMGGSKYFNERTGQYENTIAGRIGEDTGIDENGVMMRDKKAQLYKDAYKNDLKKYMNYNGDKITNTNTSEENNFDQNAGNKQDWLTNIGDYNDIKYSNIGNDYSVNIAGIGDGFSNMQGAAAYTALNNNQHERSKSDINGLKRAAQASEQATGLVGAKDRAANLYNSLGYSQNYWRQKADAQQNFYLGDIFAQKAPDFQMPESPSDPMDNDTTQDTLDDFKKELD